MSLPLYRQLSSLDRFIVTLVVMSATLMQVIDTTIINVALPHMQGALGASSDEITWTLTCYMVSSAIFMPLTGYLSDRLGRKKYLLISIAGFTVVSALCGASVTLSQIIFFRLLQGIFGAGLVPLSQAILTDIYPPEDRGKAMAIWGIGVMVGPIIGPTLGGFLTDISTWRWTFYVNLPIGFFTLLLANTVPDSPRKERHMDWFGLALISLAIGGLQFVLDRGNQNDWFDSTSICLISYLTVVGFGGFILHNMQLKNEAVFDLRIFRDRNFTIASILLCIFGLGLYGMMVIQPLMMEGLFDYPALTAGLMIAPRGISGMISMMVVSRLSNRVDMRWFLVTGIFLNITGIMIGTHYSINDISPAWLIWPMVLQGFGLGMIFVPLSIIAFATLPNDLRTEAAGLFSLLRTIGGSIGISTVITLYTRKSQLFWNELGAYITPYSQSLPQYLNQLHLAATTPKASVVLAREISRQASMLAFINVYAFIMWCFVGMLPLVFLLRKGEPANGAPIELAD